MWPPSNPPTDEMPQLDSRESKSTIVVDESTVHTMQKEKQLEKSNTKSQEDYINQKDAQQILSSSKQCSEISSSVSYASATLSTATTTSSQSQSLIQSKQSNEIHESTSCVVQSFSEKTSSEKQSLNIYQSKTSPPVEKLNDSTLENISEFVQKTEKAEHAEVEAIEKSEILITKQSEVDFHNNDSNVPEKN